MTENPLDKLIVEKDVNEVSLDALASLLQKFVRFTKEGEMLFERPFYELPGWAKITIYLLSRKVIFIKKLMTPFDESASPKEIGEVIGVPSKGISRDLATKLKILVRNDAGRYKIPHYNIHKCAEMLK